MKTLRFTLVACLAFLGLLHSGAATPPVSPPDSAGSWEWSTKSPNGEIPTVLKLTWQDGKLAGVYSNQFGDTTISNAVLQDGTISFEVVRDFGGAKYVVKYHGKMAGDAISGTIEAPGHDGGEGVTLDWHAKRAPKDGVGDSRPKG